MRELLDEYDRLAAGGPVGRAVVVSVWGSAPRPAGAVMLATPDGRIAGSVSGGCIESALAEEIAAAVERGAPRLVSFGVTDEQAWEVGLACGGTIEVFVEPAVAPELVEALRGPAGFVVATVVKGPSGVGVSRLVFEDGEARGELPVELDAAVALREHRSRTETAGEYTVFLEAHPRRPRLVVFGGVQIAQALVPLAKRLGYRTIVADGREAFVTRERFPDADELLHAWPDEAFERIAIDSATYVAVLSHDPKFDDPALRIALRSDAAYVGAIGSRKTQEKRRRRLAREGLSEEQIARLHGPIGLDLGGRAPAEIALAVLAEMTAVRYGRG